MMILPFAAEAKAWIIHARWYRRQGRLEGEVATGASIICSFSESLDSSVLNFTLIKGYDTTWNEIGGMHQHIYGKLSQVLGSND